MSKKYRVKKVGTMFIETDSEEEAIQKADELPVDKWDWEGSEVPG